MREQFLVSVRWFVNIGKYKLIKKKNKKHFVSQHKFYLQGRRSAMRGRAHKQQQSQRKKKATLSTLITTASIRRRQQTATIRMSIRWPCDRCIVQRLCCLLTLFINCTRIVLRNLNLMKGMVYCVNEI